jgi:hypothetical protein
MNDTRAHIATLDQADEDTLTPTVSDEAIEAAAGMAGGGQHYTPNTNIPNCSLSPGQCCMEGVYLLRQLPMRHWRLRRASDQWECVLATR